MDKNEYVKEIQSGNCTVFKMDVDDTMRILIRDGAPVYFLDLNEDFSEKDKPEKVNLESEMRLAVGYGSDVYFLEFTNLKSAAIVIVPNEISKEMEQLRNEIFS